MCLTKFDFEIQGWSRTKNMAANALSGLQSDHMDKSVLDENVPERYFENVEVTFSVDIVNSTEGDAPRRPEVDSLKKSSIRIPPLGIL